MSFDQRLVPLAGRPFGDTDELTEVWGRRWGASSDVGRLRSVVVRPPGHEMAAIDVDRWDDTAGGAVDPDGRWYWLHCEPPDLDRLALQHEGLVATLRAEGVEVFELDPIPGVYSKSVYVRDPFVTVPGGVVVGRLAPRMRRGEEAVITRELAAIGIPILGTIVGDGHMEGGSFARVMPGVALYGTGVRCNESGALQLSELIARVGVELEVIPQSGSALHLDGALGMIDVDLALINAGRLPWWVPDWLAARGVECVAPEGGEAWGLNLLALAPRRVLMSTSAPLTAAMLRRRGVEVLEIDYDEVERNGGGVHCSTNELQRDEP